MKGETLMHQCCEKADLDFDTTFFFKASQVALHPGSRITQQYNSSEIDDKDYIVRYFPDNDIFFVWYHIRGRNSCSLQVPMDYSISKGKVRKDMKRIGDSKDLEPVFSFRSSGVEKFIKEEFETE